MTAKADPKLIEQLRRLKSDFPYFCEKVLTVRNKDTKIVPFVLNRAQLKLHERVEEMKKRTGKVRAIIVKGRQVGGSTYVQARYYHQMWGSKDSLDAFILCHHSDSTEALFGMAKRFWDRSEPVFRPTLAASNAKELRFQHNDCAYSVATAGTKEVGRGRTIHRFHGSEVAFWPNAENHVAAVMQAVPDGGGSEIILESTAQGMGNLFQRYTMAAMRGDSDYEVIFLPWFWSDDYQKELPEHLKSGKGAWSPPPEWMEYGIQHQLTWEQLWWAYSHNKDVATSIGEDHDKPCWKFRQEFPATLEEAFQSSGTKSFIPSPLVLRARKPESTILGTGPIVLGVDPAQFIDKVGIVDRCGNRMGDRIFVRLDPEGSIRHVAAMIAAEIDRIRPDMINIDVGGNGSGVHSYLMDWGYDRRGLNAVNFASSPIRKGPTGDNKPTYLNRRAEMYDQMREWFLAEGGVAVPDDDAFQQDLCAAEWGPNATMINSSNQLVIESKDRIKQRLGCSPDMGDAAALTFAFPYEFMMQSRQQFQPARQRGTGKAGY